MKVWILHSVSVECLLLKYQFSNEFWFWILKTLKNWIPKLKIHMYFLSLIPWNHTGLSVASCNNVVTHVGIFLLSIWSHLFLFYSLVFSHSWQYYCLSYCVPKLFTFNPITFWPSLRLPTFEKSFQNRHFLGSAKSFSFSKNPT